MYYGVKRGRMVTSFEDRIDAAYTYWTVTFGSVLVWQVNGVWERIPIRI